MVPSRGSSQPPNPNPFSLGHREEHTDMGRAAHLKHKRDVKKRHGKKTSMIQKQRGKAACHREQTRNNLHYDSSRRNVSNVMNLRKQDFRAEMIKQQREGNEKIKAKKINWGSKHHHPRTINTSTTARKQLNTEYREQDSHRECKGQREVKTTGQKIIHKENNDAQYRVICILRKANNK